MRRSKTRQKAATANVSPVAPAKPQSGVQTPETPWNGHTGLTWAVTPCLCACHYYSSDCDDKVCPR
jgi:hypothetical protein